MSEFSLPVLGFRLGGGTHHRFQLFIETYTTFQHCDIFATSIS
uniref:Uncharacterized protein n=1 Tax=Rhizophora mucronata TaxID=61149 RepID=A0A2P2NNK9_RHIMU